MIRKEIELFLTALMFFTRIPVPEIDYSDERLNSSSKYFTLVGILIGIIISLLFMLCVNLFSKPISILITMVSSILLTGAFHEDGFADFCDGFGGGYTKEKILEIMKDSRLGTYGTIGIFFILLLKFFLLLEFELNLIPAILIIGNSFSRLISMSVVMILNYVSENGKAKPIATKMEISEFIFLVFFGLFPLLFFKSLFIILAIIPQIGLLFYFQMYLKKTIGGYTGDCLGALQQISEISIYTFLLVLLKWKFI
jgi:adenosylcobinamide-GDP ribazoletransferase